MIDIWVGHVCQAFCKLDRARIRTSGVAGGKSHLPHLLGSSISEFMSTVACSVIPQTGQAVDEAISVGIDQVGPFSPVQTRAEAWAAGLCSG